MFTKIFEEIKKESELGDIKGVLLDLDNTLYEYAPCHEYALKNCYERLRKEIEISYEEFSKNYAAARDEVKLKTNYQAASHSRFLYFQNFLEKLFKKTRFNLTIEMEELYWSKFFEKKKLKNGAIDFLKNLREMNLKICIISDLTAKLQFQKIKHLQLTPYVDFIVTSEEAGVEKPHGYIFLCALKKLGLRNSEVIMIGDRDVDEKDIIGARNVGIKAYAIE